MFHWLACRTHDQQMVLLKNVLILKENKNNLINTSLYFNIISFRFRWYKCVKKKKKSSIMFRFLRKYRKNIIFLEKAFNFSIKKLAYPFKHTRNLWIRTNKIKPCVLVYRNPTRFLFIHFLKYFYIWINKHTTYDLQANTGFFLEILQFYVTYLTNTIELN